MLNNEQLRVAILNQNKTIQDLVDHISALEYMLAQTMAVAVGNDTEPEKTLFDMQTFFAEKGAKDKSSIDESNPGYQSGVRVFTSVKESIS